MRAWIVGLASLALASCVSDKPFTAPDGRQAHQVSCNGELTSMAACHERAREVCGGNYDVLNRFEEKLIRRLEVSCKA